MKTKSLAASGFFLLLAGFAPAAESPAESVPQAASETQAASEKSPEPLDAVSDSELRKLLNPDQRAVLDWTDRQFRGFFDARTFDGWSAQERDTLERRSLDALNGPMTREYYQAINTLGALRSANALPRLREIAFDRSDKNNRDRWMSVRVLGILGDRRSVPDLIHLVYHGNQNTHWWAQISLVRLTGQNFGNDWNAWGEWWNEQNGQPAYHSEIIRWWSGQAAPAELKSSLEQSDRKFLENIRPKSDAASDLDSRIREATPLMNAIRENWGSAFAAVQAGETTNAIALLKSLEPRIKEFQGRMEGTVLEPGARAGLDYLRSMLDELEKGDLDRAKQISLEMREQGKHNEEQLRAVMQTN